MRALLAALLALALLGRAGASEIPATPPFQPSGHYVALTATTGGATAALPIGGPQVIVYNLGAVDAYLQLGGSGVTPAALGDVVRAGGFLELSVGQSTNIAAETAAGSASLIVSSGSGSLSAGPGAPGSVAITGSPSVSDPNNAAFQGAVALTPGTTYAAGRSVKAICTSAGNAEFQFPDGSNLTEAVFVGSNLFPYAVVEVVPSGTTAACAFSNLK